jgi:hypothetical protein
VLIPFNNSLLNRNVEIAIKDAAVTSKFKIILGVFHRKKNIS